MGSWLGLPWAQMTFAYREALRRSPSNELLARSLIATFKMRGMDDAATALEQELPDSRAAASQTSSPAWPGDAAVATRLEELLRQRRPATAVALAYKARLRGRILPWATADRIACAQLHLGDPISARQTWLEAADPPSRALLSARVGDAALAAWNLEAARFSYSESLGSTRRSPRPGLGSLLSAFRPAMPLSRSGPADRVVNLPRPRHTSGC